MSCRRPVPVLATAVLGLSLTGCVAPAPDDSAYESKAAMTAQAAVSSSRTALLATQSYLHDRLPGSYLEPVLVDSEQEMDAVRSTFDSVQPPASQAADSLRATLDPLLESAGSGVTELRIAARRGRSGDLSATSADLTGVADRLDAFAREHQG